MGLPAECRWVFSRGVFPGSVFMWRFFVEQDGQFGDSSEHIWHSFSCNHFHIFLVILPLGSCYTESHRLRASKSRFLVFVLCWSCLILFLLELLGQLLSIP